MTAVTLRGRLKDEDPEIRTAAARACAAREDPAHVADLILLLEDSEPRAARAAREALKRLAGGPDFGPRADSGPEERAQAVAAWKQWWKDHPPTKKSGQ
jgi:HEAT repeat protein